MSICGFFASLNYIGSHWKREKERDSSAMCLLWVFLIFMCMNHCTKKYGRRSHKKNLTSIHLELGCNFRLFTVDGRFSELTNDPLRVVRPQIRSDNLGGKHGKSRRDRTVSMNQMNEVN